MLRKKISALAAVFSLCGLLFFSAQADAQYNAFKDPTASAAAAGVDFKAVTEKIDGGKVAVGATAYIVVLFKNQGTASVKVGKVNLYPSSTVSAQITLNQCEDVPVSTDAQCAVTVAVMGKQSGAWRVEMLVDHDGHSRVATAALSGEVELIATAQQVTKGDLEASPASLDFGSSPGGSALVRSIVLNNRSAEAVKVKGISLAAPEKSGIAYKSQCPDMLQPEETCNIIVTWSPSSKGLTQGVLMVQHTGKSGMAQVEIKGDLQPLGGDLEASPSVLDFGTSAGGIALVKSVVLSNHSAEEIQIWNVDMDVPDKSGLSYKSQCPGTLQPEETCSVVVSWLPTSKGQAQGVLMVYHSGKSGMTPIALTGMFNPPADAVMKGDENVSISPEKLDFGISPGGIALVKSVVLSNNSAQQVKIKDISLNIPVQSGFTQKSQCPDTLVPEELRTIIVTWQPTTPGLSQGVLLAKHSGKGGSAQVEVSGILRQEAGGVAVAGNIDISPAALDFGITPGGTSLMKSIVLSNHSDEDVEIWAVTMNAPKQTGLSYESQCPETLVAGESWSILVEWAPITKGLAQGVLVVQHSGKSGMAQVEISGTLQPEGGASVVEGSVEIAPLSLDFGTSAGGIALVKTVVLSNHSIRAVHVNGVALNAPKQSGFSYESQCPEILQPDETCNIIVTWLPTTKGLAQGVLVAKHTGKSGMAQVEVKGLFERLETGEKVSGDVELSPAVLDFGTSPGGIALVKSAVFSNHTAEDVEIWDIAMNAPGKSGLSHELKCPEVLRAGESCNIVVTWLPTTKGLAQGVLMVQHSGKSGMAQVEVKGALQLPENILAAEGKVFVSPESLDFGISPGGIALVKSVVLNNDTSDKIGIKDIILDAPEKSGLSFKSQCPPEGLQPKETCNIVVTWLPTTKGLAQGVLIIKHSGKSGMVQAEVKGALQLPENTLAAEGKVFVSPESLDFGISPGGIALVKSVVLNNDTSDKIGIKDIILDAPEKSGLSFKSQCPPEGLQPKETCNIVVTWLPTTKGLAQGVLIIKHSGKSGMVQAEVKGALQLPENTLAAEGKVFVSPESLDFGISPGGIALVKSVVLNNDTSDKIGIKDIILDAPEKSGLSFKSQCPPEGLQPKETCNIVVTWLPTTKGLAQGVLIIKHSGKSGMVQAEVKGALQLPENTLAAEGKVFVSPESLDFGISPGGIALVKSVVLNNDTSDKIGIKDIILDAPEKSGLSFKSQCPPEGLQPKETCNIVVTWLPTTKGLAQGVLIIKHSGKSGMAQAEVKGSLQPDAAGAVASGDMESSPTVLDFGISPGGIALVKSVLVSNHVAKAVNIKGISLNVPEQSGFSFKSQCPEVLQPDEACNIIVSWLPTSVGQAQGVLVVQHSGRKGLLQVEVMGRLQPEAVKNAAVYPSLAPDRGLLVSDKELIDFGTGVKDEASITLSLVNAGTSDLTFKSVKLAGADNGLSVSDAGCAKGMSLKPGEACPLTLNWLPNREGAILDSLQISHTGARGVLVVPIHGSASSVVAENGTANNAKGATAQGVVAQSADTTDMVSSQMKRIVRDIKGYTITSHSATRAVINGPAGGLVVRDGEDVVISGVRWTVTIVATGVILTSNTGEEVPLTFDGSLRSLVSTDLSAAATPAAARTLPPTIGGLKMINP